VKTYSIIQDVDAGMVTVDVYELLEEKISTPQGLANVSRGRIRDKYYDPKAETYSMRIEAADPEEALAIFREKTKNLVTVRASYDLYVEPVKCAECQNMTSADVRANMLTGHSTQCSGYNTRVLMDGTTDLVRELVRGIEVWSTDCDGVHPELWNAYCKAKMLVGEPVAVGENDDGLS
jgi:hypothetical protein